MNYCPKTLDLPYQNAATIAKGLSKLPWFAWLDSNHLGRFDILTASPICTLTLWPEKCDINEEGTTVSSSEPPLSIIQGYLEKYHPDTSTWPDDIPFTGGALGFLSYDLGFSWQYLPLYHEKSLNIPLMAIGIYDWAIVIDHQQQTATLYFHGLGTDAQNRWENILDCLNTVADESPTFHLLGELTSNMTWEFYQEQFAKIQSHILAGDCYQINFAQRFSANYEGNLFTAYCALRENIQAPYSAFFAFEEGAILSVSPERFVGLSHDCAITQPIKGTRRRDLDPETDKQLAQELRESLKDQAENVMIVDLLRNDFGKVCLPGSVQVPELFELKTYSHVHHLVSTVTGKLDSQYSDNALRLLAATFPGGSITGAPKRRAMEIIATLEPNARSIYCGSIVYIGFNGNMDSNITIRTVVTNKDELYVWGGGGIVADSVDISEYEETHTKISAIINILSSFEKLYPS